MITTHDLTTVIDPYPPMSIFLSLSSQSELEMLHVVFDDLRTASVDAYDTKTIVDRLVSSTYNWIAEEGATKEIPLMNGDCVNINVQPGPNHLQVSVLHITKEEIDA
jgi:hypothetical protein